MDLDNSEESEAYKSDEICLSDGDSDKSTITDKVPAPAEPEQTRPKTTNRKRESKCGDLPNTDLFLEISKKCGALAGTLLEDKYNPDNLLKAV